MDIYDDLHNLTDDYVNNVLIHLFPNVNDFNALGRSISISPGSFAIKLNTTSLFKCYPDYQTSSNSFIHFTSLKCLHSILNEKCIRMYNFVNGNDPNEVNYTLTKLHLSEKEILEFKNSTFCLSLCNTENLKGDNILNLWRLYGHEGLGVVIEFEIKNINENLTDFVLANVMYKELTLAAFLEANEEFEKKHRRKVDLHELLKIPACFHKNGNYKIENEVRLIYSFNHDIPAALIFLDEFSAHGINYDFNLRHEVVRYYCLKLFGNSSYAPYANIKRVQIGFKYTSQQLKKIKDHILAIQQGLNRATNGSFKLFDVEVSPLENIYR